MATLMPNPEPSALSFKRGLKGYQPASDDWDNWPARSYRCRGENFEGAISGDATESEYAGHPDIGRKMFHVGDDACWDLVY